MINILYNLKVTKIAGINTEFADSKSFKDSSELLSYCFRNTIPDRIDFVYSNEEEKQDYKKAENIIIEFCNNLKIKKPEIKLTEIK
jgi:hypothetical protein